MTMMPAARVGDDIAHSNAGTGMLLGVLAGAAVGAVLVAATVATGGLALVAAAGAAAGMVSAGGLGGMYIGEASMGPACGKFVTGSPDVFINGKAALFTAGSFASCDKDSGAIPLATGSSSVRINTGMAGREGEKVGCSAVSVPKTSPNVFIGGDSAQDPRVEIHPEVPAWAVTGLQVLGIAGAIAALPFAIATVGVAATIGGAVVGAVGALGGAKAGRALGEALGLSEAGTRALETAGGFLGGMVGGAAGVRGGQAAAARYGARRGVVPAAQPVDDVAAVPVGGPPPKPPVADPPQSFPYSPKKVGQTEPGAVPNNAALQAEMDAAALARARSADGYPDLPADKAATFGDDVRPWNGDEHQGPIRRVIGSDRDANGGYWQREIPETEAEWRGGSAVLNDWNGNGGYVESSAKGLRGWIGSARPQMSSDGVNVLPGHGEQIWMPPGSANPGPTMPTPWSQP